MKVSIYFKSSQTIYLEMTSCCAEICYEYKSIKVLHHPYTQTLQVEIEDIASAISDNGER